MKGYILFMTYFRLFPSYKGIAFLCELYVSVVLLNLCARLRLAL